MGGVYSAHGENEKCIKNFKDNLKKGHLGDLAVNGRIILEQ
jgi:hypothetical protein